MRQAGRRDMQHAVSPSRLNAACMEKWRWRGRWRQEVKSLQAFADDRGQCFLCRSDLATSILKSSVLSTGVSVFTQVPHLRYATHEAPPTTEDEASVIRPSRHHQNHLQHFCYYLLECVPGFLWQAVDERESIAWVTSSRVRVSKPRVSHRRLCFFILLIP